MIEFKRLRKVGIRIVAFSLAFVAFSGVLLSKTANDNIVNAEGIDYKTMQSAMLRYFHEDTEDPNLIDKMSEEEYRVWGIFMSNLYTPFNTVITGDEFGDYNVNGAEVKTSKDTSATVLSRMKTQFGKTIGENSVAYKMSSKVQASIIRCSEQLYVNDTDKAATAVDLLDFIDRTELEVLADKQNGKSNREAYNGHYFYIGNKSNKKYAFSTHKDRVSGQASVILSATAGVQSPMKVWQYLADVGGKLGGSTSTCYNDNNTAEAKKLLKNYSLFVSPFGDILARVGTTNKFVVLVPACLNPYTFDSTGKTLYLNNAFGMANFVDTSVIDSWGDDKDKWSIKNGSDPFLANWCDTDLHTPDWGNISQFMKPANSGNTPSISKIVKSSGAISYVTGSYFDKGVPVKSGNDTWYTYQPNWSVYATRVFADNKVSGSNQVVNAGISVSILDNMFLYAVDGTLSALGSSSSSLVLVPVERSYRKYADFENDVKNGAKENGFSDYVDTFSVLNIATSIYNGGTNNDVVANRWTIMQLPLKNINTEVALFYTGTNKKSTNFSGADSYTAVDVKDLLRSPDLMSIVWSKSSNKNSNPNHKGAVASEALASVDPTLASALSNGNRNTDGTGTFIAGGVNLWAGIYWAYMAEAYDVKIDANGQFTYNSDKASSMFSNLPQLTDSGFSSELGQLIDDVGSVSDGSVDDSEAKRKQADIINWLYTILSPETHISPYVTNWLKSIVDNLVLSVHNAMIGADLTNLATTDSGTNVYHSVMGYITTPSVSQMPVVSWIFDNYMFVYIVLMVLVGVILIVYVMIHMRRIGQAVVVFIVMGFVLLLPHSILNSGILISNSFAESIFSDRFSYWAIVQHEESIVEEAGASTQSSTTQTLISNIQNVKNSQYGSGVTLKWLTPKKERFFGKSQMSSVVDTSGSGNTITMLGFYYLFNDMFQGEDYSNLEESGNAYLYRSYYSIYTSAKEGRPVPVTGANAKNKKDSSGTCISNYAEVTDSSKVSNNIANVWKLQKVSDKLVNIEGKGFTTISITGGEAVKENGGKKTIPRGYRDTYISNSKRVSVAKNSYANYNRITDALSNNAVNKAIFTLDHTKDANFKVSATPTTKLHGLKVPKGSTNTPIGTGEKTFLLYTESPYYYFYNVFSTAKIGSAVGKTDFVSLLLSEDFFKVTAQDSVAYDKTKDFLDLEGLFTYIIPYLNRANANVEKYIEVNGSSVSRADCATEDIYNYRLDDMESMWNLYSSWVDALYDINSSSQTARSGYDKVSITDPLNPASYYIKSRPMAFSPADARLKGYVSSDLTIVEPKIQNVLEKTRTDLLYLLNYKDFEVGASADASLRNEYGSEVLISAAAMIATFNFNQEFSDTGFGSSGIVLYPQSYELKNMNYDSYLRLILQNATGKTPSLSTEGKSESIYSEIISETSVFTGLFLLINDVLAVYVVPALKIVVIVLFVVLGLLLALFCMISPPEKILNVVIRNYIAPVLGFTALLCIHTWVISLFVGEGATGVLGSQSLVLTTEDPTVTLILLIVCDLVFCFALYKLLRWSLALAYKYAKNVMHSVKAIGLTAAGLAVAGVAGSYKLRAKATGAAVGAVGRTVSSAVSRHKDSKSQAKANAREQDRQKRKRTIKPTPSEKGGSNSRSSGANSESNRTSNGSTTANKRRVQKPKLVNAKLSQSKTANKSATPANNGSKKSFNSKTGSNGRTGTTYKVFKKVKPKGSPRNPSGDSKKKDKK